MHFKSEEQAVKYYLENAEIQDLITSMARHGYFDEEPLIAIPEHLPEHIKSLPQEELTWNEEYVLHIHDPVNTFVVMEGNRRLAAVLAIMQGKDVFPDHDIPDVPESIMFDLSVIPSIIYTTEQEVLPYLSVRHAGMAKQWSENEWESFRSRMTSFGHSDDYIELFR